MLACLGRIAAFLVLVGTLLASGGAAAKNGITVINQPNYNQLEIFWIGPDGAVRVMWKGVDGYWLGPVSLTPIGWGVPGSEITALWSVQNDQLEVFWVGRDGEVNMLWKDHNKDWNYPARLTGPGFALPGAPLTGFWQPEYHHLELFGIAPDGALSHVYKTDNKPWNPAGRLFGPGFGVPGSKPAAVYQPTGGQSQVFAVGSDGAVNLTWKPYNETWKEPFPVTKPGTAPAGAWLDALYQPQFDQVEVLFTDRDGAAVSVWKRGTNIYDWITTRVGDPGYAPPGAPVAAATQPSTIISSSSPSAWTAPSRRLEVGERRLGALLLAIRSGRSATGQYRCRNPFHTGRTDGGLLPGRRGRDLGNWQVPPRGVDQAGAVDQGAR